MATPKFDLAGVKLSKEQLQIIVSALDSHVYWELSDEGNRNNGFAFEGEPDEDEDDDAKAARLEIKKANKLHDLFEKLANKVEG